MIRNQFFENRDNYILWIPLFFIVGIFLRFKFCFDIKITVLFLIIGLILYFLLKNYVLRLVIIALSFIIFGILRTDRYIEKYNFPTIKYNLGKVLVYGTASEEIIKLTKENTINRYLIIDIDKIEPINKKSRFAKDTNFKNPKKLRIKMNNFDGIINFESVIIEANILPIQNKYFESNFDLPMYFYFKKIGGLGYRGRIISNSWNNNPTFKQKINTMRFNMAQRIIGIRNSLSTNLLAIILTGQKNLTNKKVLGIIENSGLSHILSISGLHMIILTNIIIFITKEIFFLFKNFPLKYNVYKISAVISLFINSFYLIIGGFSISSLRAYIMSTLTLIGILIDRFSNPLRAIMFTMLIMIFAKPNFVFRTGFYMSFMPSIAILAFIDYYYIYKISNGNYKNTPGEYLKLSIIVSSIVEIAVLPFEIYSFNRLNPYSTITNIIVNPIMSFVVIPLSLLSLTLYSLHLEYLILWPLSYIVDLILIIGRLFSKIPLSIIIIQSTAILSVFLMAFGVIWASFWTTKCRKFGFLIYIIGFCSIFLQKRPDIIIDNRDKMLIFLDERENIYVYKPNEHKMKNILDKLGKNKYYDLEKAKLDSCIDIEDKQCSRIEINEKIISFQKNGKKADIVIGSRYFYVKQNFNHMKILKTRNNSNVNNWAKCDQNKKISKFPSKS